MLLPIVSVLAGAWILVTVLGLGRMAWRTWRHNEELRPGGSASRQMFGRTEDAKHDAKKQA